MCVQYDNKCSPSNIYRNIFDVIFSLSSSYIVDCIF